MRWLLHGELTAAVGEALRKRGDQAQTMDEAGISAELPAAEILSAAMTRQLDIVTTDPDLVAVPYEQNLRFNRSMVFLQLAGGEVEQDDAMERLFTRYKRLAPGRLYTITESRVKIRQLPKNL